MFRKTSAMVEAGILAAVAVVMALISMYIPVLGAFVNFVWPLPVVICGMRHGLKWSLMTLLVASVIIAVVISPVQAFFLAAIFGLLGLILGECMRRHLPPMRLLLCGSVGAVIALVLNIVLSLWVLGIDPLEMMFNSFNDSLVQLESFYREHGFSEEDIKASVNSWREMIRMMRVIMPGAFLLSAPLMAFINYIAAKKILTKLGEHFESFPPFTELIVPGWILYPYVLSLFAVTYYYKTDQSSWQYTLAVNVQTVTSFLLIFQGIVLLYWFCKTKGKPTWWANVGTALMFLVPLFSQIMVYVGAFDIVFDFRRLRPNHPYHKRTR